MTPRDLIVDIAAGRQFHNDLVTGIRGWLDPIEGYCLERLAADGPGDGAIVEIGAFMGLSTAYLASGTKRTRRERVTAIDHFRGSAVMQKGGVAEVPEIVSEGSSFRVFRENMQRIGLDDYVVPIVKTSSEAAKDWSAAIRLLFIDGDHSYQGVRADFEAFEGAVVAGGVVCFHDVDMYEGVTKFFRELVASRSDYEYISTQKNLGILEKKAYPKQ